MSNLRTHPQPLLLKREGAKTSRFQSFLKIPLLLREGFSERDAFGKGEFANFNTVYKWRGNLTIVTLFIS